MLLREKVPEGPSFFQRGSGACALWYEPVYGLWLFVRTCECLEASLGLEPRLPVDRNLLYSDRVSEYREAYPVRRRIRTHQAQLVQRLLRHFGARARWFVWNWIGCDRSWRNTVLGRVELRFFRSLDHLVLVREFSPEDVVERLQAGA